jgi:hypothetical protein
LLKKRTTLCGQIDLAAARIDWMRFNRDETQAWASVCSALTYVAHISPHGEPRDAHGPSIKIDAFALVEGHYQKRCCKWKRN